MTCSRRPQTGGPQMLLDHFQDDAPILNHPQCLNVFVESHQGLLHLHPGKLTSWTQSPWGLENEFPFQSGDFYIPTINLQGCVWTYKHLNHALANKGIKQLKPSSSWSSTAVTSIRQHQKQPVSGSLKLYTPEKNERMSPEKKEICQQGKYLFQLLIFRGHASFFAR